MKKPDRRVLVIIENRGRKSLTIAAVLLSVLLQLGGSAETAFALRNPAAVYCEALGYEYMILQTADGDRGVCRLPANPVDAWAFLRGEVGQAYNHCTQQGHSTRTVTDSIVCATVNSKTCAVCVLGDGTEVEVTSLMGLNFAEGTCGSGSCGIGEDYLTCPADCPSGGWDGYCDGQTDSIIDPDCAPGVDPDSASPDTDGDSRIDSVDNCPAVSNRQQTDLDGDGVGDLCDPDIDGDQYLNDDERTAGSDPRNRDSIPRITMLTLGQGINPINIPTEVLPFRNLKEFLDDLGGGSVINRVLVPDASGILQMGSYNELGAYTGFNPAFGSEVGLPGMIVYADIAATRSFNTAYCYAWDLQPGINIVGSPCIPSGMTAFQMLGLLGGSTMVSSIQSFDPASGKFMTAAYDPDGTLTGPDFGFDPDKAYFIHMKEALLGFRPQEP